MAVRKLFAVVALGACAVDSPAIDASAATAGAAGQAPVPPRDVLRTGAFTHRDVRESSAAVRSATREGLFWTLNDSGNDARLFAFTLTGRDLGAVRLRGVANRDWEAMATGPCAEGACLYVGEIGDNAARHATVTIWRVPEPVPPGAGRTVELAPAARLVLRYPEGPRDAEAMWVDADTAIWIATKRRLRGPGGRDRPSLVYRAPASAWRVTSNDGAQLTLVDSLPIVPGGRRRTLVTDASLSDPFGTGALPAQLAVRTYELVYIFDVERRSGRPGTLRAQCDVRPLREPQGEGITWLPDGRLLLTTERRFAPLHTLRCP